MMSEKKMRSGTLVVIGLVAFVVVLVAFYGLNHFAMGMQGLPLNLDLTPAQ